MKKVLPITGLEPATSVITDQGLNHCADARVTSHNIIYIYISIQY